MLYLETHILFLDGMQEMHFMRIWGILWFIFSLNLIQIVIQKTFFQFFTAFYDVSPLCSMVDGAPFWQNFILYAQNTAYPRKTSSLKWSTYNRGFTKFGIKVLWRLQSFIDYRTLSLKFQKARPKIEVVLSLPNIPWYLEV